MGEIKKRWYVIRAISGKEKKVKELLELEIDRHKLNDYVDQVLIPTEKIYQIRKGKKISKERNYFPGYVLIKVELTKQIYHMIKNLQKVSGFLGSADKPTPISDSEIKRIAEMMDVCENKEKSINLIQDLKKRYTIGEDTLIKIDSVIDGRSA